MPKPPIQLKRSGTASATPSSLEHGELALNYADSKVFFKTASNTISSFTFQAYALASHTHAASDITSGTLDAARIANDSITYAKLQNVSAQDRLLGRSSAGSGDVEEITCTAFGRSLIDDADAAAARTTLSVQPTASPAFTGAATFDNTGNVVPLTVTNAGTANSFVVNDASGDTSPFVIDAAGNVGIGVTPSYKLEIGSNLARVGATGSAAYIAFGREASDLSNCLIGNETGAFVVYGGVFGGSTAERFRLNTSGQAIFSGQLLVTAGSASACGVAFSGDPDTGIAQLSAAGANTLSICTNSAERMRVDSSGNVLVGQFTTTDPAGANTNGVAITTDYISLSRSSFECLRLNLKAADGTIVALFQEATLEGSISVAGNTVSYNAFCGSHWAQLIDNSRPSILRGTVLETIDDMCEWPEGKSDRLARVKVSDTPASRRVYGVFMAWDDEYASTGDLYATALGAYMVRVSGVVQSGDLLESAGDGTARTQPDDIVRSSTIGKVSSTHRVAEYDDGSYLVPCVLMCG